MAQQVTSSLSGGNYKELDVWENYKDFAAAVPFMIALEKAHVRRHDAVMKAHRIEDHVGPLIRRFHRNEIYECMSEDEKDSQAVRDQALRDAKQHLLWLRTATSCLLPDTKEKDECVKAVRSANSKLLERPGPPRAKAKAWAQGWMEVLAAMLGIAIHILAYYRPNSVADAKLVAEGNPIKTVTKDKEAALATRYNFITTNLPKVVAMTE